MRKRRDLISCFTVANTGGQINREHLRTKLIYDSLSRLWLTVAYEVYYVLVKRVKRMTSSLLPSLTIGFFHCRISAICRGRHFISVTFARVREAHILWLHRLFLWVHVSDHRKRILNESALTTRKGTLQIIQNNFSYTWFMVQWRVVSIWMTIT